MKLLILLSILAPTFNKHISPEFLTISLLVCLPLLWSSWDLPEVFCLALMSDKVSSVLVMLSLWVSILMSLMKPSDKLLNLNIICLVWSLVAFFSVSSLLTFFILFEASLIPTLCLIVGWGYQPERLEASYYFVFYTITLSMPLLSSLLWLMQMSGSKYFYFDSMYEIFTGTFSFLVLAVFMIKLPLFMVHMWLPKAHTEAPVVGSMILAGVLLKTGGYGILRVFLYMEKTLTSISAMVAGFLGMVYVCFMCLHCTDLKQIIAYSSVSHMNFMIIGLMNNSMISMSGCIIMMVSHGICSSLMFMLADFSYKRCSSRSTLINKGLLMVIPPLSMFWSITVVFNMAVPPSAGSISELLIIACSSSLLLYKFMFSIYLFLSAFYSIFLYVTINHGITSQVSKGVQIKEAFMVAAHLLPLASLTMLVKMLSL